MGEIRTNAIFALDRREEGGLSSVRHMKERENAKLRRLSTLALRHRRRGLVAQMPPLEEVLRGSLVERYLRCGKPNCRCARGRRHGPLWYLTVTLGPGRTTGGVVSAQQLEQVRRGIERYRQVKQRLEQISNINRELLRRARKG